MRGLISTATTADRFQITDRRYFCYLQGEALRILRTNSSKTAFEENISNFKKRLIDGGYPQTMIENLLSDIKFTDRDSTLKDVFMKKWNLIQNQPLLRQIFREPPIISYKKRKSLKDMLKYLFIYFTTNL